MTELDSTGPRGRVSVSERGAVQAGRPDDRLRRVIRGEILPRFLGVVAESVAPHGLRPSLAGEFEEFFAHARADDGGAALEVYLDEAVERGFPVQAVFDDLIAPVARQMGVFWEEDSCDFFEVTVVCSRLQGAIRRLSSRYQASPTTPRARILVSGLPGAEHSLGLLMVAEAFAREDYAVSLGEPLVHGVHPGNFDLVALTVTRSEQGGRARDYVMRLRALGRPELKVIVGGFAFRSDPCLIERVGADGWADSPEAALNLVGRILHLDGDTSPSGSVFAERGSRA